VKECRYEPVRIEFIRSSQTFHDRSQKIWDELEVHIAIRACTCTGPELAAAPPIAACFNKNDAERLLGAHLDAIATADGQTEAGKTYKPRALKDVPAKQFW
jgi:hypothetical protein